MSFFFKIMLFLIGGLPWYFFFSCKKKNVPWLKKGSKTHSSQICLPWDTASTASIDRDVCPCAALTVPVLSDSHLQHQTVPLLQVHREQRRGQVRAEGPRTEEDPTGDRRYAVCVCVFVIVNCRMIKKKKKHSPGRYMLIFFTCLGWQWRSFTSCRKNRKKKGKNKKYYEST